MTVPPGFRRNTDIPKVLVLHKAILQHQEIEERDGYCIVTPLRAILDLLKEETEDRTQLRKALRESVDRGLITRRQIELHPDKKSLLALMGVGSK
ncbi:MAG TPA: hypothetical protein DCZ95_19795 [Verrucomicrobia bacterium]|nr:hypothetical protein [Verrucomicrobiota bacterium]